MLRSLPLSRALALVALAGTPLLAQEAHGAAGGSVNLLDPHAGLMFWTLLIFVGLLLILSKFAFKPITAAVEARERALEEAIEGAKRDRDAAAALLAEQRQQLEGSRVEAQRLIADSRAAAEKMRAELLDQTRDEQAALLERAKRDIEGEKERAIAEMRREAVDLALAGASKVIERNLDDAGNRRIVEEFLASVPARAASAASGTPGTR